MRFAVPRLLVAAALVGPAPTLAHHAQAPFYDQDRFVEISGVVTRFEFINPHPHLYVEVTDAAGAKVEWAIQFPNRTNMIKRGWNAQTVRPGEVLTAVGHPSFAPGTHGLQGATITRADGTVLIQGRTQPPE
ncbi:MAG: DUF6152 family protein [Rhodospirillaceae bacterium]|nr:DUF6152 family protein [Rhodospirillaceae bacterium]